MIPHLQTLTVGNPHGVPGNCMQAVVASLLDMPMEQVPHFALFKDWRAAVITWLADQDKRLRIYSDTEATTWERRDVEAYALNSAPSRQMMIAAGDSPNGPWSHVVLWKAGALVHDPHPLAKGLASAPWEFWQVTDV